MNVMLQDTFINTASMQQHYTPFENVCETEKMSFDKFEPIIVKYMRAIDPNATMSPYKRAKAAYKRYKEDQTYSKRLKDLEEKEKMYADNPSSLPAKSRGKKEIMDGALKSDKELTEVLKSIQFGQEASMAR